MRNAFWSDWLEPAGARPLLLASLLLELTALGKCVPLNSAQSSPGAAEEVSLDVRRIVDRIAALSI